MADKISLTKGGYDDLEYEPSDSEEEYTEKERKLLKNVRQRGKKRDVEEEILRFDESEDEDDEDDKYEDLREDENLVVYDSDIEDDKNDDIPDPKAWGKKRSMYYYTDFVDQDFSAYNEKEEELALQEEEEAKAIQQRLAKQLNEVDFSLDVYTDILGSTEDDDNQLSKDQENDTNETETKSAIKLKTDIGNLTERQKQQLFKKDSPEFFGLTQDFEKYLQESQNVLQPFLEYISEYDLQSPTIQFVETMNNMIFTYCTNIAFYLMLKTKRIPVKNHPVIKRLVKLRQILQQLESKYNDSIKIELTKFIEMVESGVKITFAKPQDADEKKSDKKIRKKTVRFDDDNKFDEDSSANEKDMEEEEEEEEDEEAGEGEERRAITYQMAKNKGLTPHRKKELKNPRVKHRKKYRKALIRRKGAIRTVRKELKRYDGEISGIKATVKKGIKIKN